MTRDEALQELIPKHMHRGLIYYLDHHIEPGSFLYAILCNNLRQAVHAADHINMNFLPRYVQFLYEHAPSTSWGSEEKVQKWLGMGEK